MSITIKMFKKLLILLLFSILYFLFFNNVRAEIATGASMSSDNFKVLDAQHGSFGGVSSSSSGTYILTGSIGDIAIGSSSITNFKLRSGFLYYPQVIAPVLNSATAGVNQVALAWTTAIGLQGFSISGYNVCTKTTGAYICEDVSNVVVFTKSSLTAGTTYTFKIEAKDGLDDIIATSNELSAVPTAASTPTPTPPPSGGGGGGGGGGGYYPTPTPSGAGIIVIKGTAYPQSTVNVLLEGAVVSQINVDSNAGFEVTLNNVPTGSRVVNLFSMDANNRKSITLTFTVTVTANATNTLTNVLMPPTIDISSTNIRKGDTVRIFGYAEPTAEVNVHVASEETVIKTISDSNGAYAIRFDTKVLVEDDHTTKSRAIFESLVSPFSHVLQFIVGKGGQLKTADSNKDGKVNIIDFSILLYWWDTKNQTGLNIADINKDNKVNITDFSIMLFQWTG